MWLACALALAGCAARVPTRAVQTVAPVASPAVAKTAPVAVILISIDGYRADYLQRGLSPNLVMLAQQGVRARWMTPSFPTLTFPNHYTLVTGRYPDHHGIVANEMEDPAIRPDHHFTPSNRKAITDPRWWDGAMPLWVSVQQQGGHAATMFWPGSEAAIHGVSPDRWVPFDPNVSASARVDRVLHWLDLPISQRPRFITLYFGAVDRQAHRHGPDSAQVDAALRDTDAAVGQLIQGLRQRGLFDRMDIVVVSDHGMAAVRGSHRVYLDALVNPKHLRFMTLGAVAGIDPSPAFAARIEHRLLAAHPHMRCWRKRDIPARLHYGSNPRVPAIVCLAQTGWLITTREAKTGDESPMRGAHGYDNADPLMRALFVAEGPSFRRGYVAPPFPNVDVYPLLAHLLRVAPEENDGNYAAVTDMLVPGAR